MKSQFVFLNLRQILLISFIAAGLFMNFGYTHKIAHGEVEVQNSGTGMSCAMEYALAFDYIDLIHEKLVFEDLLDSSKSNKLTGSDMTDAYARLVGSYKCQGLMLCQLVQKANSKDLSKEDDPVQEEFINLSEFGCAMKTAVLDESEKKIEIDTTVKELVKYFHLDDEGVDHLKGCYRPDGQLDSYMSVQKVCIELMQTKEKIYTTKVTASLQRSAARKRMGYIAARLNDLHQKMNPDDQSSEGIVQRAQKFMIILGKIIDKIGCVAQQTVTK